MKLESCRLFSLLLLLPLIVLQQASFACEVGTSTNHIPACNVCKDGVILCSVGGGSGSGFGGGNVGGAGNGAGSDSGNGPVIFLSPFQGSTLVDHRPMALQSSRGPAFAFQMHYSTVDSRNRASSAWPVGYRWSHNYQMGIESSGSSYTLVTGPYSTASFAWTGTNFVELFKVGSYSEFSMEAQGSNIVVRRRAWDSLAMPRPGSASSCASCGAGGGQSPAAPEAAAQFPPYLAWHANEGWEFEPDGGGSRYRLLKQTGPCGLSLRFDYSNNLLSHVTTADSNVFAFAYTTSALTTA